MTNIKDVTIGPVWITKYALTSGIQRVEKAKHRRSIDENMISYGDYGSAFGNDWHTTWLDAKLRAKEMRRKKIATLERQIEKLHRMTFEEP